MNRWKYIIFIGFLLIALSLPGLAQNTGNILNLPSVSQPTPDSGQTPGQLPALDFSFPVPSSPQPGQPQIQILDPKQNQTQGESIPVVWKKYNLKDVVGATDPVGRGLVEYPENWHVMPDNFNRMISFNEDAAGLVSLKIYIISYVRYSTANDYVAAIVQMLSPTVTNMRVINKDEQNTTAPSVAAYGGNNTLSRYELQGNVQGTEMTFGIEAAVFSLYDSNIGNAAVYWAPTSVYQQKYKDFFSRMITSYKDSVK